VIGTALVDSIFSRTFIEKTFFSRMRRVVGGHDVFAPLDRPLFPFLLCPFFWRLLLYRK